MAIKIESFVKRQESGNEGFFKEIRIMAVWSNFEYQQCPRSQWLSLFSSHSGFFIALLSFIKFAVLTADTLNFEEWSWQDFFMSVLFSKCLFSASEQLLSLLSAWPVITRE